MPVIQMGSNLVMVGEPTSLPARRRFIGLLDVLGMKSWLNNRSSGEIAGRLDWLIGDEASKALSIGGGAGPVLGIAQFSDTLLFWTPDDTWASLHCLSMSLRRLLQSTLHHKIPMRGAISVGEAVCLPQKHRFVGPPIADAHIWGERNCDYRGLGVSFTESALCTVMSMMPGMPAWCGARFPLEVLQSRETIASARFAVVRFRGLLMIQQWDAYFLTDGGDERGGTLIEEALTHPDRWPSGDDERNKVRMKIAQTKEFHLAAFRGKSRLRVITTPEMRTEEDAEMRRLHDLMIVESGI
jgi:hypothetical protein